MKLGIPTIRNWQLMIIGIKEMTEVSGLGAGAFGRISFGFLSRKWGILRWNLLERMGKTGVMSIG